MKAFLTAKLSLVVLAIVGFAAPTNALPISGEISFVGTVKLTSDGLNDTATTADAIGIKGFMGTASGNRPGTVQALSTGDYAGVADNTPMNWKPFLFTDLSVSPLWAFEYNSVNYSFHATSISILHQDGTFLDLEGTGIARIDNKDDTFGTWTLTVNGGRSVLTFTGDTTVPDAGATVGLLGLAVGGLVFARRLVRN